MIYRAVRKHLHRITAVVMLALAINALYGRSLVVMTWVGVGATRSMLAAILVGGAVMVALSKNDPIGFFAGTTPLGIYTLSTIYVTIDRGGGYSTAIMYTFAYLLMLAHFEGANGGSTH